MATKTIGDYTLVGTLANADVLLGQRGGVTYRFTYDTTQITTLGTITTGTWNATTLTVSYGGTGRATATAYAPLCGGTTATGAHQSAATGSSGQLFQSGGASALPGWTTATYPVTASTSGKRIKSNGTNFVTSTTTMPDTGTTGKLIRGDGTNYVETTATFADTYSASSLLYSNGANTVTGLATANSGVLVTNGSGVPSISTDIPTAVTIGSGYIYRASGTDVPVADGGTGVSSLTAYAVVCGGTTSTGAVQSIASVGTSGHVLTSNGAGALPTFQAPTAGNGSLKSVQVFTASGTWTKPAGVNYLIVEVVGGGGGGGSSGTTANRGAAGGGGGGYSRKLITSASATETVTVGTGGAAGSAGNGGNGNTSSFGAHCSATGGTGGLRGSTTAVGGAGGSGASGTINVTGGAGSCTYVGVAFSGFGGGTLLGSGGPGVAGDQVGQAGGSYGGGGSGASTTDTTESNGGAGADGVVVVWEYS